MIIPFSSRKHGDRHRQEICASRHTPYMPTALAYRLSSHDQAEEEVRDGRMGFLDHLEELRRRLIRACVSVVVGMTAAFVFIDRLVGFVLAPTRRMLPPDARLIYTQPGEAFGLYVTVSLMAGALFASPYIMWQVWRFIAPGLYARERKLALPFVVLTSAGAVGGAAFNHYVMFPALIAFFGTFQSSELNFMPRLEDVFDLYTKMLIGMCVVFQIPTLAFFLGRLQLVTARLLWRNFRYAILAIFIAAAVLTPSTDPWNQTVFAAPMIALYLLSIGIVWCVQPKRAH
jgi:sec-independent protein translocase protein TatC